MRDKLMALEALQKVDVQIAELDRGGAEYPKRLAALESELAAARGTLETERARLAEVEKQKRTVEEQLAADKEKVKKWEGRLTEQRSTREYAALAREIDIAKKQNATMSDEIVALAQEIEELQSNLDSTEERYAEKAKALGDSAGELRTAMDELSGRRNALLEKRAEAAKGVDAVMLRRYDTIKKRRGTVIAAIVSGACKGCNMHIPPQLNNELRTTARLDVCPSCGRMIYCAEAFAVTDVEGAAHT